jgi:hypothetical protein
VLPASLLRQSFDRTCELVGTEMCTGPVDEQCELDHTSHEFEADLGRLFLDLSFWPSDNQRWADRSVSPETVPVPVKPPRL